MKSILVLLTSRARKIGACLCLGLLSSCATAPIWFPDDSIRPGLPADTAINKGAGRGDLLYLTLRLVAGEELLFLVDTGSPCTLLDKSLDPKLGKRLGTTKVKWLGGKSGGKGRGSVYRAPKLYLDRTEYGGFWGGHNLVGLRFLARHKVTLNFPKRTMYWRREGHHLHDQRLEGPRTSGSVGIEKSVDSRSQSLGRQVLVS